MKKGEREVSHSEGVLCVELHNPFHQDEEAGKHKDGNLKLNYKKDVSDVDYAYQDLVYYPFTRKSMNWTKKISDAHGDGGFVQSCYV
jgi:hypothetical protein